jgi:outer membrane biosynthesis protein TonB
MIVNAIMAAAVFADPVTKPPQIIEQATPDYSDALRSAGISGQVVVQFGVDASGAVQNATVIKIGQPSRKTFKGTRESDHDKTSL